MWGKEQIEGMVALTQQRKVPIGAGWAVGLAGARGWCARCIAGFSCEQSLLEAPILGRCWGRWVVIWCPLVSGITLFNVLSANLFLNRSDLAEFSTGGAITNEGDEVKKTHKNQMCWKRLGKCQGHCSK